TRLFKFFTNERGTTLLGTKEGPPAGNPCCTGVPWAAWHRKRPKTVKLEPDGAAQTAAHGPAHLPAPAGRTRLRRGRIDHSPRRGAAPAGAGDGRAGAVLCAVLRPRGDGAGRLGPG